MFVQIYDTIHKVSAIISVSDIERYDLKTYARLDAHGFHFRVHIKEYGSILICSKPSFTLGTDENDLYQVSEQNAKRVLEKFREEIITAWHNDTTSSHIIKIDELEDEGRAYKSKYPISYLYPDTDPSFFERHKIMGAICGIVAFTVLVEIIIMFLCR